MTELSRPIVFFEQTLLGVSATTYQVPVGCIAYIDGITGVAYPTASGGNGTVALHVNSLLVHNLNVPVDSTINYGVLGVIVTPQLVLEAEFITLNAGLFDAAIDVRCWGRLIGHVIL